MSAGRVIQINASQGGVPKTPLAVAEVNRWGIVGDAHRYHAHGGLDKAILLPELCAVLSLRLLAKPQ